MHLAQRREGTRSVIKNGQILPRIIVDTREQKPYQFPGRHILSRKLDIGDYSLEGFEDQFAIERKELSDLVSCMVNKGDVRNRERFERELDRAKESLHRLWILVEADYRAIQNGNYRSELKVASAEATILAWENRYPVCFKWAGSRERGAKMAEMILERSYRDWADGKVSSGNCCNKPPF
jgi:ERCC4-type nuclease